MSAVVGKDEYRLAIIVGCISLPHTGLDFAETVSRTSVLTLVLLLLVLLVLLLLSLLLLLLLLLVRSMVCLCF